MAESATHISYVKIAEQYVRGIIPNDAHCLIEADIADYPKRPTRTIGDFIPDLYFSYNGLLVIGEAKTENDIDRKHSKEQYQSYLFEATNFSGTAHIVIVTSIYSMATAVNYFRHLKQESGSNVVIHILNNVCPTKARIL